MTVAELQALDTKLGNLQGSQKQRSRDMRDALSQSSETWHDNAPRDVLLDAAKIDVAMLTELTKARASAVVREPENNKNKVGLMTRFGLEDLETIETEWYQMTGVGNYLNLPDGVSCEAPLGKEIFGKDFFDTVKFRGKTYMIVPPDGE